MELRGLRDREILAEIFSRDCYRPPRPIHPKRVLDLGANIGLFSAYALCELGAESVVAVEPDPMNLETLEMFVDRNRLPVEIVRACAGTCTGTASFLALAEANSRKAKAGEESIEVPVVDVLDIGPFDLAKIDIEGGEWELLEDRRFPRLARWIVMEWHSRNCPTDSPEDAIQALVQGRGLHIHMGSATASGGTGYLWLEAEG